MEEALDLSFDRLLMMMYCITLVVWSNAIPLLVVILAFRSNSPHYLWFFLNSETQKLHTCGKTSTSNLVVASFESQPVSRKHRLIFAVVFSATPGKVHDTTLTYGQTVSFHTFSIMLFHYSSYRIFSNLIRTSFCRFLKRKKVISRF